MLAHTVHNLCIGNIENKSVKVEIVVAVFPPWTSRNQNSPCQGSELNFLPSRAFVVSCWHSHRGNWPHQLESSEPRIATSCTVSVIGHFSKSNLTEQVHKICMKMRTFVNLSSFLAKTGRITKILRTSVDSAR